MIYVMIKKMIKNDKNNIINDNNDKNDIINDKNDIEMIKVDIINDKK